MVRFLLFAVCLVAGVRSALAQDWATVRVGDTARFSATVLMVVNGNELPRLDTTILRTVWITDAQASGGDTTYSFFRSIRASDFGVCIDTAAPAWLGPGVTRRADGREVYYNSVGDSIVMYPKAPLFATWVIGRDTAGNRFEGTIGHTGVAMIDGVPDSVKTLLIQAFSGTATIQHEYNNLVLQWSKSHGWIKTLDFYRFPNYMDEEYIGTHANRSQHTRLPKAFGSLNLDSINILAKYAPGNEWMWLSITGNSSAGETHENGHDSVMNALPYSNGVIATVRRRMRKVMSGSWTEIFTDAVVQDTILRNAAAPRLIRDYLLPDFKDRPMYQTTDSGNVVRTHPLYRQYFVRPLCGSFYRVGNRQRYFGSAALTNLSCWKIVPGSSAYNVRHTDVVPGFGVVYDEYDAGPAAGSGSEKYEVYYFKMGGCVLGAKFPVTASVSARAANRVFSISPNPATEVALVRMPVGQPFCVAVADAMGRVFARVTTSAGEAHIQTASLPTGLYFVEISGADSRTTLKLQVAH